LAGALPKHATSNVGAQRARLRAAPLGRAAAMRWLAPGLLTLATVLAIAAAYSVRPFVAIDIGDYYDRIFLPNMDEGNADATDFFAREVSAIGPEQITPWPASQAVLELAGRRQGLWQVTIEAAADQPDRALAGLTLSANDVRLWIPRSGPRELVAIIPADIAAADQLRLRLEPGLADDPAPPVGLVGRVRLAPARTYRWTSGQSTIRLPGLGRGDWNVTLVASLHHPDNQPLDVTVAANGVPIARLPDGEPRQLSFLVPSELVPDGDLTLTINSKTYKDPRELGMLLYELRITPAGQSAPFPPLKSLLYALTIALGLYWCLLRMIKRPVIAALLALALVLAGAWALATARYPTAFMLQRLAILAIWSVLLLLALEWLMPWVFAKAGVPLSSWLLRALLLVFFAGFWIKAGGMLYPYFVGIDLRKQLSWAQQIWNGQFWLYYGTDNPMNAETMPIAQWGNNKPVIPYSPWFHIFLGSFAYLPLPTLLAAHMFSALVDTSRVFLLALLARKSRFSERETLFGTLLLAVTPVTFLLHSWGNLPTTFGIWWTLVSTVFIVVAYRRLDRPWPFVALTLLLTITLLMYTVVAVFMGVFLCLLVPALWLVESHRLREHTHKAHSMSAPNIGRRRTQMNAESQTSDPPSSAFVRVQKPTRDSRDFADDPPIENRRPVIALALAGIAALGLATLIYYGQYIPLILERTVPYFFQAGSPTQAGAGAQHRESFLTYLAQYIPLTSYFQRPVAYGLQLALLLAIVSLGNLGRPRLRALLICWAIVAALFTVVGSRIDMVDKQIFYLAAALALLAGRLLAQLWQRGLPARLVVASVYLFTFVAALDLWIFRIMTTRQ
jgi:hypothetical protein